MVAILSLQTIFYSFKHEISKFVFSNVKLLDRLEFMAETNIGQELTRQ